MTQEEFKKYLDNMGHSYYEKDDKIVVDGVGDILILENIPYGVLFTNCFILLHTLKTVHYNTLVNNKEIFTRGNNIS